MTDAAEESSEKDICRFARLNHKEKKETNQPRINTSTPVPNSILLVKLRVFLFPICGKTERKFLFSLPLLFWSLLNTFYVKKKVSVFKMLSNMIQLLVLLIKFNHNDRLNFGVLFKTQLNWFIAFQCSIQLCNSRKFIHVSWAQIISI